MSEMLAEIAPSVAGWPAAKPNIADAPSAIVSTPAPTLRPFTMCWPTSIRVKSGRRQRGIGRRLQNGGNRRRAPGRTETIDRARASTSSSLDRNGSSPRFAGAWVRDRP